jgi:hypothetical protein
MDRTANSTEPVVENPTEHRMSDRQPKANRIGAWVRYGCLSVFLAFSAQAFIESEADAKPKSACVLDSKKDVEKENAFRDPVAALDKVDQLKTKPWAKEWLKAAGWENPQALLTLSGQFEDQPYYREVVLGALHSSLEKDPTVVFIYSDSIVRKLLDKEGDRELRAAAAKAMATLCTPEATLYYAWGFHDIAEGWELLRAAMEKTPWAVFDNSDRVAGCKPFAESLFRKAMLLDPKSALRNPRPIFRYEWMERELIYAGEHNPETALLNLEKIPRVPFKSRYAQRVASACLKMNPEFLEAHLALLPEESWKGDMAKEARHAAHVSRR